MNLLNNMTLLYLKRDEEEAYYLIAKKIKDFPIKIQNNSTLIVLFFCR